MAVLPMETPPCLIPNLTHRAKRQNRHVGPKLLANCLQAPLLSVNQHNHLHNLSAPLAAVMGSPQQPASSCQHIVDETNPIAWMQKPLDHLPSAMVFCAAPNTKPPTEGVQRNGHRNRNSAKGWTSDGVRSIQKREPNVTNGPCEHIGIPQRTPAIHVLRSGLSR